MHIYLYIYHRYVYVRFLLYYQIWVVLKILNFDKTQVFIVLYCIYFFLSKNCQLKATLIKIRILITPSLQKKKKIITQLCNDIIYFKIINGTKILVIIVTFQHN